VSYYHKSNANGSAIIAVLVLLTTATTLLGIFIKLNNKNLTQFNYYKVNGTLLLHVNSVEDFASDIIKFDYQNSPNVSSLDESWNNQVPNLSIGSYNISSQLYDLQSKININNLIISTQSIDETNSSSVVNFIQKERLENLFEDLYIDSSKIDAVIDWIDENTETFSSYGAEDDFYLSKDTPYRSANNFILDIDELLLVKGFDMNTVNKLKPFITAIAPNDYININTITPTVLKAVHKLIGPINADKIINQRTKMPFGSIKDFAVFLKYDLRFTESLINEIVSMMHTSSNNYLLKAKIILYKHTLEYETMIQYKPDGDMIHKRNRVIKKIGKI